MPGTHSRTTTQRGLGYRHKQQVAHLKRVHVDGSGCWWCGEPMFLTQGLAGDHSVPRSAGGVIADRLLHGPCNSERGDGSRDHLRPVMTGRRDMPQHPDLGVLAMRWP